MQNRPCWPALAGLVAILAAAPVTAAQEPTEEVQVTATALAGCGWMVEGRGGNIVLCAGDDGVFMVDDQYAPLAPAIREAVRQVSEHPVRFVLNTHWHGDHTGGNEAFGESGAIIVAHANVRERMSTEQFMPFMNRRVPASAETALPVVTFGQDVSFHVNGETVYAFHVTSAHTDGDAVVHFRNANVLHTGDIVFYGLYPFIDVGSGGSVAGVLDALERILPLVDEATLVVPGHGPLTDREGLIAYRYMLTTVSDRIAAMLREGMDLAAIQAARPTAGFDETWGEGFIGPERFVEMLYGDLSR